MAAGDVEGFAAVAFPLVRRVFGSLIANDLVSVQPMSLPSGLIFFLDFTFGGTVNDTNDRLGFSVGDSVYGGGRVGSEITGGVLLAGEEGTAGAGAYNLRNGYSSPTGSGLSVTVRASGTLGAGGTAVNVASVVAGTSNMTTDDINTVLRFDPDLTSGSFYVIGEITLPSDFNKEDLVAISNIQGGAFTDGATTLIPRLTQLSRSFLDLETTSETIARVVFVGTGSANLQSDAATAAAISYVRADDFLGGGATGSVVGGGVWGLENEAAIPEIDIKVDSVAVTAVTKKLKAKWTPELGQDLNAYHNLDAEVLVP
jgi:hypothetical protein